MGKEEETGSDMPRATLTSKGQITLPKQVRERLGLRAGDRVAFRERPDGSFAVEAEHGDLLALQGLLRPRRRGVTVEAMGDAIRRRFAGR